MSYDGVPILRTQIVTIEVLHQIIVKLSIAFYGYGYGYGFISDL